MGDHCLTHSFRVCLILWYTFSSKCIFHAFTPLKNWFTNIRQNTSHMFLIVCAHVIVEHNPVEKHMVYVRLFAGWIKRAEPSQSNLLEKPLAVSCYIALKIAFINMGVICYNMGTKYQKHWYEFCFMCLDKFLTDVLSWLFKQTYSCRDIYFIVLIMLSYHKD